MHVWLIVHLPHSETLTNEEHTKSCRPEGRAPQCSGFYHHYSDWLLYPSSLHGYYTLTSELRVPRNSGLNALWSFLLVGLRGERHSQSSHTKPGLWGSMLGHPRRLRKRNLYNYTDLLLLKYLPTLNTKGLCKRSRDSYCSKLIFFVQYYANCINFILLLLLQAVYPKAAIH